MEVVRFALMLELYVPKVIFAQTMIEARGAVPATTKAA